MYLFLNFLLFFADINYSEYFNDLQEDVLLQTGIFSSYSSNNPEKMSSKSFLKLSKLSYESLFIIECEIITDFLASKNCTNSNNNNVYSNYGYVTRNDIIFLRIGKDLSENVDKYSVFLTLGVSLNYSEKSCELGGISFEGLKTSSLLPLQIRNPLHLIST